MLSFFRRIIKSKLGIPITLGILAVIALAFAAGDINSARTSGGSASAAVTVGNTAVSEADLRQRVRTAYDNARQQSPGLTMEAFVAQGGFDAIVERTVNDLALQQFAQKVGMAAGKRAVDGEIASIPAFQGFDGKFSQAAYDNLLRQQGLTDKGIREDIERGMLSRQLIAPTAGATQVPTQLALPYASLLLERRQGTVAYIPVSAIGAGAAPTDAELQTYYARQRARYTIPERRVVRYALVKAADIAATAKPSPAEIAQAYNQNRVRFAASEKRALSQVVLADQAAATALAAKVKGGASIADAARAAGLEASTIPAGDKAAITTATSAGIADAVFAAAQGAILGPLRSPLGWHVVRVDAVQPVAGKSLAEATPELSAELGKVKAQEALAAIHDKLDDAIGGNATFDEVVTDGKLSAQATAPITAAGVNPAAPTAQPDPAIQRLAQAAFAAEPGDSPQLVQMDADGSFAVVGIGNVVPAAPPPLAQIRDQVLRDFVIDRNLRAARALASAAVTKINGGTPLGTALQGTGVKLPPVQTLNATRAELARQSGQLPPPVALMFSMAAKRAKMLEAPNRGGYFIVYLNAIQSGNATGNPVLVTSTQQGLGGVSGRELSEQFAAAVRKVVDVKRNEAVLSRLRADLSGTGAPATN
ncbi:peptidylprolyl isomerase [Sphingomonas sp. Leaf33]|uniref:peptidylprolyl isomerase n=1 Tax=Sphingomonas sp. Leaf33 TaxID=1736215 RepID=UPI0006F7EDE2|nr:peptidylprolyl isomerase [Sphingomonas sp. Leaf33]KQN26491.1 peptidylprolyl isomerase [Sphingomonas sp. Leaf33]